MLETIAVLGGIVWLVTGGKSSQPSAPEQRCSTPQDQPAKTDASESNNAEDVARTFDGFIAEHLQPEADKAGPAYHKAMMQFRHNVHDYTMALQRGVPLPPHVQTPVFKRQWEAFTHRVTEQCGTRQ